MRAKSDRWLRAKFYKYPGKECRAKAKGQMNNVLIDRPRKKKLSAPAGGLFSISRVRRRSSMKDFFLGSTLKLKTAHVAHYSREGFILFIERDHRSRLFDYERRILFSSGKNTFEFTARQRMQNEYVARDG